MTKETNMNFGEKMVDTIYAWDPQQKRNLRYDLQTAWGPKYEADRTNAEILIKKFGLTEEDFWITRELTPYKDQIIYSRLLPRHSACIKINSQQKKEKRFDISCVREANGSTDGTIALIYQSEQQDVFEVGEANRYNAGCSYLYGTAKRRLFDKVVTALTSLYDEGSCGEEDMTVPAEREMPAEENRSTTELPSQPVADAAATPAPQQPAANASDVMAMAERIKAVEEGMTLTGTNKEKVLAAYRVKSLEDMNDIQLSDLESIIESRLSRKREHEALEAAKAQIDAASTDPSQNTGISPIAAMMVQQEAGTAKTTEQKAEAAPVPIGETVYVCLDNAPENYQELSGKTFDQIGKDTLKALYGRKNASGRRWVDEEVLGKIEKFIA